MRKRDRSQLGIGVLLILLGAWFLAVRQVPALRIWSELHFEWPFFVDRRRRTDPGHRPAYRSACHVHSCLIVAGIGGILYYQNSFADWDSWSFLWTLIPVSLELARY